MVKSLDEQIKSLQERQAQLKARENDLVARRRERERKARTKRLIEVGAMAESAAGFEGGDERAKEHIARLVQLGSLVEAMCSTDVMGNYTSREDLRATVAKALEHNVRTSDGMNWNLQDLVYEALSEEWRKRDGEDNDPWENHGPDGYQPPSYEPLTEIGGASPRLPRSETTTGTAAAASRTVQAAAPQPAHAQPQSFTPNPQRIEHRTGAQQPDQWA